MTYMNNPNRFMSEPGIAPHKGTLRWQRENPCQKEYSRLLTAAVINTNFRKMLLANPAQALTAGYGEENFHFSPEEFKRVASIQATSLADFAEQLIQQRTSVPQYQNC
jgi:hypothetical protein